jgi:orotidine-5'-phosphate decarboxylase
MTASTSPISFGDRLARAVRLRSSPVMVGLDPRADSLPRGLLRPEDAHDPQKVAQAYVDFCAGVMRAVQGTAAIVKPQMAFFEALGPHGLEALAKVVQQAHADEFLVVLDGKRNDIGSTAEAYAQAYLGRGSRYGADAITVSPYLGDDSLAPFVSAAKARGGGLFVLVKTSNPGGKMFQDLVVDGRPLYGRVADHVQSLAKQTIGESGYGAVGAVVGATYPEQLAELRMAMPNAWLLVPGYGAQGAGAKEVAGAFDNGGLGAVINSSRNIIFAHAHPRYKHYIDWIDSVAAAAEDMLAELRAETSAGKL